MGEVKDPLSPPTLSYEGDSLDEEEDFLMDLLLEAHRKAKKIVEVPVSKATDDPQFLGLRKGFLFHSKDALPNMKDSLGYALPHSLDLVECNFEQLVGDSLVVVSLNVCKSQLLVDEAIP